MAGPVWMVLGTMMPWGAAVLAAALAIGALPGAASAQATEPRSFGVERFRMSSDRDGMFDVEWAEARGGMAIDAALWAGFASEPLVLYQGQPGNRVGSLVADRAGGSLGASISPTPWLQLALDLPLVIYQDRPADNPSSPMALGPLHSFGTSNLRLSGKLVVLHQADAGVSLAVIPALIVPTRSASDAYLDDRGFGFAPELALSRRWTGWRAGLDVGYRARQRATFLNQVVDDELFAHAGAGYRLGDRGGPPLGIDVTMSAATAARAPLANVNENHLESLAGVTYDLPGGAQLFSGAGVGLRKGFGTPDWRGLVGIRIGFGDAGAPARPHRVDLGNATVPLPPPPGPATPTAPPREPPGGPGIDTSRNCAGDEHDAQPPGGPGEDGVSGTTTGGRLRGLTSILFTTDQTALDPSSHAVLDHLARQLKHQPSVVLQVEGYTDNAGDALYNLRLSQRRAEAVVEYLVDQGIDATRLSSHGFGAQAPRADNATPEGRAMNRRVEFTTLDGDPWGQTDTAGPDDHQP